MTEPSEIEEIRLLTAEDLAKHFALDVKTVLRWEKCGILPPAMRPTPKCTRWRATDIAEWIRGCFQPHRPQVDGSRYSPCDVYIRAGNMSTYVPRKGGDNV